MYRAGPVVDQSSLIQQAAAAIMMSKQLIELFAEGVNNIQQVGKDDNLEEISTLIGQAGQIHSSLWTQLDHASHCIADLQRDAAEYRSLRAALGGGVGQGILDVRRRVERRGRAEVVVTTVVSNRAGLQQAATAFHVLATLLPEVDWTTQIKKQATAPVVDLQRGTKRLLWGTVVAFLGGLAYLIFR